MPITKLNLTSFRNLPTANISLLPEGINIICGQNGSGKTSLLEAICTISCGKSFRTRDLNQLIHSKSSELSVYAELLLENKSGTSIGISRSHGNSFKVKLSGNTSSFSELAHLLPVRVISPVETIELINSGPDKRRSFLDWGVFHVKHEYWSAIKRFNKLLKQKSAALKARCGQEELLEWNKQFCNISLLINRYRQNYFTQWLLELKEILCTSNIFNDLNLSYYPGWNQDESLPNILKQTERRERQLGYCTTGPHRADIILKKNGGLNPLAKEHFSRGQQKLLAIAMYLAQGELLKKNKNYYPLYLIDDFTSELDVNSQQLLLKMLKSTEKQIIITTLDLEHPALKSFISKQKIKLFNIEKGKVTEQPYKIK